MDKMTNVEKASREIAVRLLGLCQQFLDTAKAVRIAGPMAPVWLQVSDEDIEGEFFIDVEGGSTQAINPATRYRQGQEMITQIVPMLTQLGYDPEPALRAAIGYMGMNPEQILVRPQAPEAPPMPETPEMPGQMPMQETGMMPEVGMDPSMMQQLSDMGAPPVPGAIEGDTLI
jgi:hypothetical protein